MLAGTRRRPRRRANPALVALLLLALTGSWHAGTPAATAAPPMVGTAQVFPADNVWNRPVTDLPVHPLSASYLNTIGLGAAFHADFGAGQWDGGPIGIPYTVVSTVGPNAVPFVPIRYGSGGWPGESDPGPMPIPANAPIEGGPNSTGDRHVLVIDQDRHILYELYRAFPNSDGSWTADSTATWPLDSNALRPDTWTSADAAGLPIFAGLARYDEVASGTINHALRFTVPRTQQAHLWPARHDTEGHTGAAYPPMGLRLRLKANVNIASYPYQTRVILQCLKDYGMILADNGSAVYVSGAPDPRWDDDALHAIGQIHASDLEVVDESGVMVNPNTAQATAPGATPGSPPAARPAPAPHRRRRPHRAHLRPPARWSAPPRPPPCPILTVRRCGEGTVTPGSGAYPAGARVRLTATPQAGWVFAGWRVDDQVAGYAPSLVVTMNRSHAAVARFNRAATYSDLAATAPQAEAVGQLGAADVIHGYGDGTFGPDDPTLRAQMAALIARAMGWDAEDWGTAFADPEDVDANLWRNVGTLAHYDVARGYEDGTYAPKEKVLQVQTISFIARALVARGWWVAQPDDRSVYPNVPLSSGARIDLATYTHYVGPLPDTASTTDTWSDWDRPATRAWFAQALWLALQRAETP